MYLYVYMYITRLSFHYFALNKNNCQIFHEELGISLRILIRLQAGRPESGDSILSWGGDFSLRQRVKTTPEGHLSFHPIDTGNFFREDEADHSFEMKLV